MRIFNRFIVWFLFIFATSGLYAQEFSERNNLIGTELLSLAFGGYLGHYSSIFNDGKYELGLGIGYFNPEDDNVTATGIYPSLRIYHNGKGKGTYYEVGLGGGNFSLDYQIASETAAKLLFFPSVYIGYRMSWNFGLVVSPYIGMNYVIGKLEAEDGTVAKFGGNKLDGGLSPAVGLELGYMF